MTTGNAFLKLRRLSNEHKSIKFNSECNAGKMICDIVREQAAHMHKSGLALKSHQDSAHRGAFNPTCPACQELHRKWALSNAIQPGTTPNNAQDVPEHSESNQTSQQ